ncbi:hypothetical protein ACFC36_15950 [Streptomyces rubiginosohelvolus]
MSRPALVLTVAAALLAASIWSWIAAPYGVPFHAEAGPAPAQHTNE